MAYSQQVLDRFHNVLKDPVKHSVGKFDPEDPNVATGMTCLLYTSDAADE